MSTAHPPGQRPRQATVAGWLVITGGIAVVVSAWSQISRLRTLDSQSVWRAVLDQPPLAGSGVSLERLLDIVQVLVMVSAACAVAAVILGWHALQRSRTALIALSIVSVPLFIAGLASGGVFPTVIVVAVVMLWLQPARDWYAGRTPSPAPRASDVPTRHTPTSPDPTSEAWAPPRVSDVVYADTPSRLRPTSEARGNPEARPNAVVLAAILTWLAAALGIALLVGGVALVLSDPARLWREMLRQEPSLRSEGVTQDTVVALVVVMAVVGVVWLLAAAAMAVLVWLRIGWARTVLVVLAALSGVGLLLASLASVVAAVPMIGAVLVAALLMRPEVTRWLDRRPR